MFQILILSTGGEVDQGSVSYTQKKEFVRSCISWTFSSKNLANYKTLHRDKTFGTTSQIPLCRFIRNFGELDGTKFSLLKSLFFIGAKLCKLKLNSLLLYRTNAAVKSYGSHGQRQWLSSSRHAAIGNKNRLPSDELLSNDWRGKQFRREIIG